MNKTGQIQTITIFVQVAVGIFFWTTGIAEYITWWTQRAITTDGLTGLVAFILAYMNLWIFLGFMLMVSIGSAVVGGSE